MKFLIVLLFVSVSAFAQEMNLDEAMMVFDQHSGALKSLEVGSQLANESYEMHGECVLYEKNVLTVVEVKADHALLLNEQLTQDKCKGTEATKKYLVKDSMVDFTALKTEMQKRFKGWKINRKENLMTFELTQGSDKFTMQYDLRTPVLGNWVHYHHSYPGVEDHNIRNFLSKRNVTLSEVEGLPVCTRDHLSLENVKCD